jgi:hypothetical protein
VNTNYIYRSARFGRGWQPQPLFERSERNDAAILGQAV